MRQNPIPRVGIIKARRIYLDLSKWQSEYWHPVMKITGFGRIIAYNQWKMVSKH